MKKMKSLLCILIAAVMIVSLAIMPANVQAAEGETDSSPVSKNGLTVTKEVNVQPDGTYVVDLEGYATGTVTTKAKPVDLILVLDVSGSMDQNINSYTFEERPEASYSYSNYYNREYYYKHSDNKYYRVYRGYRDVPGQYRYARVLYYDVNGTRYYLSNRTSTTTPPNGPTYDNDTIWTGVLYTRQQSSSQSKMSALKTAVNSFVGVVADKNQEILDKDPSAGDDALSRVSIVKFAMNRTYNDSDFADYQSNMGDDDYYFSQYGYTDVPDANYTQVVRDLTTVKKKDLDTADTGWYATVNKLHAAGATAADYGMGYAEAIYNKHKKDYTDRDTVVVMFTDGQPTYGSDFSGSVANSTINYSKTLKDSGAKVYSVAILDGANPSLDPKASGTSPANKYLHGVSSNYPDATAYNDLGNRYTTEDGKTPDYYFSAESADDLNTIFTDIAESSSSSELGTEAVMKDIVSSSFTLPEKATTDTIDVKIVPWDSTNGNWDEEHGYTIERWKTACKEHGAAPDAEENVSVTISEDGKTVDITGFDYSTHFLADKGENKQAAKIVVSFPIQAKPSAITGASVATNGEASGIYATKDDETAIINFPVPEVTFTPVTYVVDYVTSDTTDTTDASVVKLNFSKELKNITMLDEPGDDVLIGKDLSDFNFTIYKGRFGTISFGQSAQSDNLKDRIVNYAPTTMDWNDYERIFIKGDSNTSDAKDVWAMLSVLPANNVYYEDTYITQNKKVPYGGSEVTIEYTGINYKGNWNTDGTEGDNKTQHNNTSTQGWIDGMADDTDYSNGMAHKSNVAGASANFTFSGTGVDIYSRTDGTTGTILVTLTGTTKDGTKVAKSQKIDNKAASGPYYQIPTCTFTDLEYGTYKVTIYVTSAAKDRLTYYLDGVRVYNPIQPHEDEELVQEIYGEKNLGAFFTEVRSLLVGEGAETGKAIFIDEHSTDDGSSVDGQSQDFSNYEKEGPKSEVYLAKDESVAISVESGKTYYIGLKEISGDGTTAELNGAKKDIRHTSDLYYDVTPASGNTITVTNTGEGVLSVTKLRTTGVDNETSGTKSVSTDSLLTAFRSMAAMSTVEYDGDVITEEEAEAPIVEDTEEVETPAVDDTSEETVQEETVLTEEDITIDNSASEETDETEETQEVQKETTTNDWYGYLSSFFNFFRRGRY